LLRRCVEVRRAIELSFGVVSGVGPCRRNLQHTKVYSPLEVVRLMLSVNRKKPLNVTQMSANHFMQFGSAVKSMTFGLIPYSKGKEIVYSQPSPCCVQYKTSFSTENYTTVCSTEGTWWHECPTTFRSKIEAAVQSRKSDKASSLSKEKICYISRACSHTCHLWTNSSWNQRFLSSQKMYVQAHLALKSPKLEANRLREIGLGAAQWMKRRVTDTDSEQDKQAKSQKRVASVVSK